MIAINKPITRKTRETYNVLHARKARPIVVRLCPGDVLEFREHRRRQSWSLPIDEAFRIAVRCSAGMALCFVPVRPKPTR